MALRNDKNYPEPTGKKCTKCKDGRHLRFEGDGVIFCNGTPPYCFMCRAIEGACPYCHGTGLERTH